MHPTPPDTPEMPATPAVLERNKQIVRRYVEAFNAGDMEAMEALFTPDAAIQGVLGKGGLSFAFKVWRELHDALQCTLVIEEMCAEGHTVAVRFTETGRFVAPFRFYPGVEPTRQPYTLVAMEWFTFNDAGHITSRYSARDGASQMRQIGVAITP